MIIKNNNIKLESLFDKLENRFQEDTYSSLFNEYKEKAVNLLKYEIKSELLKLEQESKWFKKENERIAKEYYKIKSELESKNEIIESKLFKDFKKLIDIPHSGYFILTKKQLSINKCNLCDDNRELTYINKETNTTIKSACECSLRKPFFYLKKFKFKYSKFKTDNITNYYGDEKNKAIITEFFKKYSFNNDYKHGLYLDKEIGLKHTHFLNREFWSNTEIERFNKEL